MDKNKNGLIEPGEAMSGRWSLRVGSRGCKLVFFQDCDKDVSKGVSRQEGLNCFKIQGDSLIKKRSHSSLNL